MRNWLITTYAPGNPRRRAEFEFCLQQNLSHFDAVTVISEYPTAPSWFTGEWHHTEGRPTYSHWLSAAAALKVRDQGNLAACHIVIANADIVIPRVALRQIGQHIQPGEVYCLSRWNITERGIQLMDAACSQDVWAFHRYPDDSLEMMAGYYPIGVPGCDNRFAHELHEAGHRLLNPSRDIKTFHFHQSKWRPANRPSNRVPLPYMFVKPHRLGEDPEYSFPTMASTRASRIV